MMIRVRQSFSGSGSSAGALLLSLAALHCGDGAVILLEGPPPAGDTPAAPGVGAELSESPEPGTSTPGEQPGTDPQTPSGPVSSDGGDGPGDTTSPELPPELPAGACQPRAVGGPFWLTEQDTVTIPLECATGLVLSGEQLQPLELPANARYDAATRAIIFTPGLDQASVYRFEIGVAGASERGQVEVQVADRFDAAGNAPVDPATYTEEFGLPVLHLTVDSNVNDEEYLPASITYRGHAFQGAEAKLRGHTSLRYPKNSYTLKFDKTDRFADEQSVAGFSGKRKLTLTTTFDDNSYLRARLAFELWNRSGVEHVQVQSYSAVVYLNGQYWGLYTVTDHVDKHLMEDSGLFEDGNLYKARSHDANFRLTRAEEPYAPKLSLSEGFTKEEGTPLPEEPGANADLEALVAWVSSATPERFAAELEGQLARSEYESWWLLVSLIQAGDSAGKNTYHYRDPRAGAPDGRFHVVPWDFNESFGQTWLADKRGREAARDPEELASYNLLFERFLSEPALRQPLLAHGRSLLENEWRADSVLASLDAWAAEIQPAATRDERKWSGPFAQYYANERAEFTTHEQEIEALRQWIGERWQFVADYY